MESTNSIYSNVDFNTLANEKGNEDTVRERIILPLLYDIGYKECDIERSKKLNDPFIYRGSNKKIKINLVPDYCLKVGNYYSFVLDAKASNINLNDQKYIEQVYSYAENKEVNSKFFALCNGINFVVYKTNDSSPILNLLLSEYSDNSYKLKRLLSPSAFNTGNYYIFTPPPQKPCQNEDYYLKRQLLESIEAHKQSAKRHYGVHGYFTRQSWNVVQGYIKNFSQIGDLILDPFGGSGVTAIEALMTGRKAIQVDLNPLCKFMVDALVAPVNYIQINDEFQKIVKLYERLEPKTDDQIEAAILKYPQPKPLLLPKSSDVPTVDKLFSKKQLACLGLLKYLIVKRIKDKNHKLSLLLAFYNTLSICNLTFHKTPHGGGNYFGCYYRYRMAKTPTYNSPIQIFKRKFDRILTGKREMENNINKNTLKNLDVRRGDATDLSFLPNESVDYIYTDPPYGSKIQYLDLSTMWNAWLDLPVTEDDYKKEAIEGGEHHQSKETYNNLISKSIKEMFRVLKFDRWLTFVYSHKDPEFWHLIVETAEECGFEYIGAVPQKNGQTSFKKRQNPYTVLSGQLMINFRKSRNPKTMLKANIGMKISDVVFQSIEGIIAKNNGATLEEINDELIMKGLELGFLDLLRKEYSDITPLLMENYDYNESTQKFNIKPNTKFTQHINIELRIRYYLLSYMRRLARENKYPTIDEIIMEILPFLKNGTTPEKQTILNELQKIAIRIDNDRWELMTNNTQTELKL